MASALGVRHEEIASDVRITDYPPDIKQNNFDGVFSKNFYLEIENFALKSKKCWFEIEKTG